MVIKVVSKYATDAVKSAPYSDLHITTDSGV